MTLFQQVAPEIMLGFEKPLTPVLQFFSSILKLRNHIHRVPLNWDSPGEDDLGMTSMIHPLASQWGMFFPGRFTEYFNKTVMFRSSTVKEKKYWVEEYIYLLKKISLANHGKQLILKSPPHTARISTLLEIFPGARFIYLHRDPFHVYGSTDKLWDTVFEHYALGKTKHFSKHETILQQYDNLVASYLDQRTLIPADHLIEIAYDDLVRSPVDTMKIIFDKLGIEGFESNRSALEDFSENQKKYKKLLHHDGPYDADIEKRWARFFDEWHYPSRLRQGARN
jgi:hypothetical protein